MILSDASIEEFAMLGMIEPYNQNQLQPASYDLRLSELLTMRYGQEQKQYHSLAPGEFILGSTREWINMPIELVGRIEGKSSLARKGLIIHTAGFIDPGFCGNLTLEITNFSTKIIALEVDMLIAQIAFQKLDRPARMPYGHPKLNSHYQNQKGVTPSAT